MLLNYLPNSLFNREFVQLFNLCEYDSAGNKKQVGGIQVGYEIKSGATYSSDYFKGLRYWANYSQAKANQCNVIYTGEMTLETSFGKVINW
ncbi:MAG: hypothetical protein Q7U47_15680 [Paludibacter sp.]|nr:hypothetical protein [Paludibacter sp.]